MDSRTLSRLRVAFVLLGVLLLAPLWLLVRAAQDRLEEQRRLRHEIVAERIFDEMERELGALLERERLRPSAAYAAADTHPQAWAPFVVGYFTHDENQAQVTAGEQLLAARAERVRTVADRAWQRWTVQHEPAAPPARDLDEAVKSAKAAAPTQPYAPQAANAATANQQEEVLRKLNRGSQQRESSKQSVRPKRRDQTNSYDDPLLGL